MNETGRLLPPWLLTGSIGWIASFGFSGMFEDACSCTFSIPLTAILNVLFFDSIRVGAVPVHHGCAGREVRNRSSAANVSGTFILDLPCFTASLDSNDSTTPALLRLVVLMVVMIGLWMLVPDGTRRRRQGSSEQSEGTSSS